MNPDSPSARPLRQRFRDQARAEVLEAAERVLARDGVADARIDAVAAEAGVSVGTVYNLFGDRAALVQAVLERGRVDFQSRVRDYFARTEADAFEPRLRGLVHMLVGHMRAHWPMLRMLAQTEGPGCRPTGGADPTVIREIHRLVSALVRQGIEEGALAGVDDHVTTCALMGSIRTTIDVDVSLGLDAPTEARADAIVQLFLSGAGRRP